MAYMVMAYTVIAHTAMAQIVMAYNAMRYIAMASIVMAHTIMALFGGSWLTCRCGTFDIAPVGTGCTRRFIPDLTPA